MLIDGQKSFAVFFSFDLNHCLLQLKIHGTCPGELEDVVKQLEECTGSVVVGQIGRTVILYRPSLSKQKAEEKKKQVQRDLLRRQAAFKQSSQVCFLFPETCSGYSVLNSKRSSWTLRLTHHSLNSLMPVGTFLPLQRPDQICIVMCSCVDFLNVDMADV